MAIGLQTPGTSSTDARYADFPLHRITLEQYERMIAAGILADDDRCFLLDGVLVAKLTKEPPHVTGTRLTLKAPERAIPAGWHVRQEAPVDLPDGPGGFDGMPEPDLSVVRGETRDYRARTPQPEDSPIVVEVADSSLRADRKKIIRYAWVEIPTAWIVSLEARIVEVYTAPSGPAEEPGYRETRAFGESEVIPVPLDGIEVGRVLVADLLP